jgi:hypothetical protein
MKIGIRKPSIAKSISARTSIKRVIRHNLGLKAPRGFGWFTNPKKALYNRIYNRTSFSIFKGGSLFKWLGAYAITESVNNTLTPSSEVESNTGINAYKLIVNIIVLVTLFGFFYGVQDSISMHYNSQYWEKSIKGDLRLFSSFIQFITILIVAGFDIMISWVTIMFVIYMLYFFVIYLDLFFLPIILSFLLIRLTIRKLKS